MKICKEINLGDYDLFSDFADELHLDEGVVLASDDDGNDGPCYLDRLEGTQLVDRSLIPVVLEAACYFHPKLDGLLQLSVSENEANHKDWLEAVSGYPGVHIVEHQRCSRPGDNSYKVWLIHIPVIPVL